MPKLNCWEFKKCGREPGGAKIAELGVCSASANDEIHGVNAGIKGGRACWVIAGTLCGGKVQGTFALKFENCMKCEFYASVKKEEGSNYKSSKDILEAIQKNKNK